MNLLDAHTLALRLFETHHLCGWEFQFDRAKTRIGSCQFHTKKITLSRLITELNSELFVSNALLHEIAHALIGPHHGHDRIWKTKVFSIGGIPRASFSRRELSLPRLKYTATCPVCRRTFQAQKIRCVACRDCCQIYSRGKYKEDFRFVFRENRGSVNVLRR